MRHISKPRPQRLPSWAGDDFRRSAESALTHPATVAALGVLLLNDLLLKALWPHSWLTGKLSDLAWMVFALPLLAFLLSFATRGNRPARRLAFALAYAGLPLLYAAFNAFDPVHDSIMRGISLMGGAAGSPRDATDSLVIPFAWAAALWVWRLQPAAPGAMRLRWAVLVAGVAALASVATSEFDALPVRGAASVGISENDVVVVALENVIYESLDGGLTWSSSALPWEAVSWGGQSVDTPRGSYTLDGTRVLRVSADRGPERVAFSTEHLLRSANVWVQRTSTQDLGAPRVLASRPLGIVYDRLSGNLIVALGIQGVVVGMPSGKWTAVPVNHVTPTNFSFLSKTRLLLSDFRFWSAALALSVSMTGFGLISSQHRPGDLMRAVPLALLAGVVVLALTVALLSALAIVSPVLVAAIVLGTLAGTVRIGTTLRPTNVVRFIAITIGSVAVLTSGVLLSMFGSSNDDPNTTDEVSFIAITGAAWLFGIASVAASPRQMLRCWPTLGASLAAAATVILLAFMLWLHMGLSDMLTKLSAIAFSGVAAIVITRFVRWGIPVQKTPCPTCVNQTEVQHRHFEDCGAPLVERVEASPSISEDDVLQPRHVGDMGLRIVASILDLAALLLVAGVVLFNVLGVAIIFSLLVFSPIYSTILVGRFATTLGKSALKLRVVRSDGSRVGYGRAFLRELAKFGPLLLVSAVVMAFRADRRGLHDLLADTVVVRRDGS